MTYKNLLEVLLCATLNLHLRLENSENNCGTSVFAIFSKILLVDQFLRKSAVTSTHSDYCIDNPINLVHGNKLVKNLA